MIPATGFVILAASMLVTALPGFAQMPAAKEASMTCQQMMARAQPLIAKMTDKSKVSQAQHVMANAKAAMENGNEEECKIHMQKVMAMTQGSDK
jgi:hypothetical protein